MKAEIFETTGKTVRQYLFYKRCKIGVRGRCKTAEHSFRDSQSTPTRVILHSAEVVKDGEKKKRRQKCRRKKKGRRQHYRIKNRKEINKLKGEMGRNRGKSRYLKNRRSTVLREQSVSFTRECVRLSQSLILCHTSSTFYHYFVTRFHIEIQLSTNVRRRSASCLLYVRACAYPAPLPVPATQPGS